LVVVVPPFKIVQGTKQLAQKKASRMARMGRRRGGQRKQLGVGEKISNLSVTEVAMITVHLVVVLLLSLRYNHVVNGDSPMARSTTRCGSRTERMYRVWAVPTRCRTRLAVPQAQEWRAFHLVVVGDFVHGSSLPALIR
jgi:hypothetical protein